ncbi:DUF155-domain-containing protein [Thelephora terrestris]|uniref:DUF155-domain-containing protein n=1 Tax=Thelephora terrestris TaxID=56493 RepID=A0A9P6HJU4_9AGAM|nr:DUF155-domain-containing protein [Thelephora terrestris]
MASQQPSKSRSVGEVPEPKPRGPHRTTKTAGKLKVLPEQPEPPTGSKSPRVARDFTASQSRTESSESEEDGDDEAEDEAEVDAEVYNQLDLIPAGTARRDALRLTKKRIKQLPRVTAYATASSYRFQDLMKFFNARRETYHTNPQLIDEVIYTPYAYNPASPQTGQSAEDPPTGDLLGMPDLLTQSGSPPRTRKRHNKFTETPSQAEIFLFEYGTVVIWGMAEAEEKRFLSSLKRFEVERLAPEDIEMEDLNFYYANYSRIYNDVITLRKGSSYMTKLSLSHALAQSVKISLFESLISTTIEETKDIPETISETGKIGMPHKEIMRQIGELFLLRTNLNSVGSVLDSPEVFWTYPDLQPLYDAARSYLEISQRINLLNSRVQVLQDMLQLLKDSVSTQHAERLERIVIALIGVEIILGIVTIIVDLFS